MNLPGATAKKPRRESVRNPHAGIIRGEVFLVAGHELSRLNLAGGPDDRIRQPHSGAAPDLDGKSFAYRTGAFMKVAMTWRDATRRQLVVRIAGEAATRTVTFDGRRVQIDL